ncbi:MAG: LuxR C-terminal-related transcriptional regulator, partial [Pseudomonadota bacterium]
IDDPLDALGIDMDGGLTLRGFVQSSLQGGSNSGVALARGFTGDSAREVTVALVDIHEGSALGLLFVIDATVTEDVVRQIGRLHDLTQTETVILHGFLQGKSLADIATERDRSLATIRTQFNTVLAKFSVSSQSALVRVVFGLSRFFGEVEALRPVFEHPFRRHYTIPGAGGRSIEFFVAGDAAGDVVIHPSDVLSYTYSAAIEQLFHSAGLCVVSVARPGIGGTDPALPDHSMEDCHTADVAAVLRALEVSDYLLFGSGLSSPLSIHLGGTLPGHLRGVVLNTPMIPRAFFRKDQGEAIPILHALMRAGQTSPKLLRFLLRSAEAHIRIVGARRFISTQFAAIPMDKGAALQPDNLRELQFAIDQQYTLGSRRDESDFLLIGRDWSSWIAACRAPITVLHGAQNPVMTPVVYDRFQAAYPDRIQLWPLADAAAAPGVTHPEQVIACLRQVFDHAS